MIRTKIVVTLGPACSSPEILRRLLEEGADVCRFNFSHGDAKSHLETLKVLRDIASDIEEPIAVLGDLPGPKIRLGQIADQNGTGGMPINVGQSLHIQRETVMGNDLRVSTTYSQLVDDVRVGDRILIEDGLLRFIVIEKTRTEILCTCTAGGILKTAKGINLPNTPISIPSLTERDKQWADFAIENGFDYIALSFVRKPEDLLELKKQIEQKGSSAKLIAKIEKSEAVERIDSILDAADGLMVARGDLGVELDVARVPIIQKELIRRCQSAGKPVIVATQMLQSMIEQTTPTRAEVSDVANAIYDGADATMLSGETSVGRFPAGAVHTMAHIAQVTQEYLDSNPSACATTSSRSAIKDERNPVSAAVARGLWQIVCDLRVTLVAVWSQSGATARIFSRYRFPAPIIAFSSNPDVLRQLALHYGVLPRPMDVPPDLPALIAQVDQFVLQRGIAGIGQRIAIVAGSSMGLPGTINAVVLHELGADPSTAAAVAASGISELER